MAEEPETGAWPQIDTSEPRGAPRPPRTCKAVTAAGKPCHSAPLHGDDFCYCHSPNVSREERTANRVRGGENRRRRGLAPAPRVKLPGADQLAACIVDALSKVRTGVLKPATGESIARIATCGLKALDAVETSRRLEAIEARLDAQEKAP